MSPVEIVNLILDTVGYNGGTVLESSILEPSFGTGNFLVEIVSRIIDFCKCEGFEDKISAVIKSCVFGIEKDKEMYDVAVERLNALLVSENVSEIDWNGNLICGDALMLYESYKGKFDYIVGNPPYISIHNIPVDYRDNLKNFRFSDGTSDLYIIFYEMGIQMLNQWGKLGFITPNTFLRNVSQKNFRNYLITENLVSCVFDFKTSKLFSGADTYTCICVLDKDMSKSSVLYREYNMYDIVVENSIDYNYFVSELMNKAWDLSSDEDMSFLEDNKNCVTKLGDVACIQNAIQTSEDTIFIQSVYEDEDLTKPYMGKHTDKLKMVYFKDKNCLTWGIESTMLRRCVKESRFSGDLSNTYIIFPYKFVDGVCIPLSEDELEDNYSAYLYFSAYKEKLSGRNMDSNLSWFVYGRSQGLQNINNRKIVFKHMMEKGLEKVEPYILDEDVVVYAGMYTTVDENICSLEKICEIYSSSDFAKYCSMVGKDMSGGYVTVSCKNVKQFGLKCI